MVSGGAVGAAAGAAPAVARACCFPQPRSGPAASHTLCSATVHGTTYINGGCLACAHQQRVGWGVVRIDLGLWSPWCPRTFHTVVPAGLGPCGCHTMALSSCLGNGSGGEGAVRDWARQSRECWQPPGQGASCGSSCHLGRGGRANSQRGNGTCLKGAEQLLLAAGVVTGSAGLAAVPGADGGLVPA